jgi:hypothetical protein
MLHGSDGVVAALCRDMFADIWAQDFQDPDFRVKA